jgi:predicted nucleic acid-binding protein
LQRLNNKKEKRNNICDSLIGETAYRNKLILVTNDKNFGEVMREIGCGVESLDELMSNI